MFVFRRLLLSLTLAAAAVAASAGSSGAMPQAFRKTPPYGRW